MTNAPSVEALEPCPFCNSATVGVIAAGFEGAWIALCTECGAQGPGCHIKDKAIAAWNTRPLTAEIADLRAQLDEALEALGKARAALHQHYVDWDGEPEDAVPLQMARSECDRILAKRKQP